MKRFYLAEAPRGEGRENYTTIKGTDGHDVIGPLKTYPLMIRIDRESSLTEVEQITAKLARRFTPVEGKDFDVVDVIDLTI